MRQVQNPTFRLPEPTERFVIDVPDEADVVLTGSHDEMRRLFEGLSDGSMAVVNRARFERLREFARNVTIGWYADIPVDRVASLRSMLQDGDIDPLP